MKKQLYPATLLNIMIGWLLLMVACDDKNTGSEVPVLPKWKEVASFSNFYPASVWFTEAGEGFIAGAITDSSNRLIQGSIRYTDDNGQNWQEFTSDTLPPLSDICMNNSGNGFAAGGECLLRTTDNGKTWSSVFRNNGWFFQSVSYDGSAGVMATDLLGRIVVSNDMGEHWNVRTGITSCQLCSISNPGQQESAIAVGIMNSTQRQYGIILRSTDQGTTWDSIPFTGSLMPCSVVRSQYSNHFIAAGGNTIMRSTDGGSSWKQSFYGLDVMLIDVSISASGYGFAVGQNGGLLKTTNDGNTWTYETRFTEELLLAVFMQSDRRAYAVSFDPQTRKARLTMWN